ncbi:MAG: hypothetical protein Q9187_008724, partial [Circinaria calcarea]
RLRRDSRIQFVEDEVEDEIEVFTEDERPTRVARRPSLANLGLSGGAKRRKISMDSNSILDCIWVAHPNDTTPASQGHGDFSKDDPPPRAPNTIKRRRTSSSVEPRDLPSRPQQSGNPIEAVGDGDDDVEASIKSDDDATFEGLTDSLNRSSLSTDGFERLSKDDFDGQLQSWYASQDQAIVAQGGLPYTQEDIEDEQMRAQDANAVPDESELVMDLGWTDEDLEDTTAELEDDVPQAMLPLDTRTKRAELYTAMLDTSLTSLLETAVSDERLVSKDFVGPRQWEGWLSQYVLMPILASTDPGILRQIINGNLARAWRRDPSIKNQLGKLLRMPNWQPAIYMQLLVNSTGHSPSPEDLSHIIEAIRNYCNWPMSREELESAVRIDEAFYPHSNWGRSRVLQGQLKYLAGNKSGHERAPHRVDNIRQFANNLEARLNHLRQTPAWTQPLANPL